MRAVEGPILATPRLSPDGTRVALTKGADVFIQDLESGRETKLTEHVGLDAYPAWRTPDGTIAVTFSSDRGGSLDLYVRPVDLSSQTDLLLSAEFTTIPALRE